LPKVARGQLKGAALAVFVPQGPRTPEGYKKAREDADKKLALIKAVAEQSPKLAELAYSPADVRRIASEGKFAVVISLLNAYPLGSDLTQLDEWYKRGVRILGYVHAGHKDWADSSRPNKNLGNTTEEHGGLSDLGKQGVARLNQLGVLIDVSQLSSPAFKQVLSLTKAPVAATHSGVKSIVNVGRNLSDEELELIRKNGGVSADRRVQQLSSAGGRGRHGRKTRAAGDGSATGRFARLRGEENRNRSRRHFIGF
jgi:microsomal dipeptidase-like Zn-dependent dipeptidase